MKKRLIIGSIIVIVLGLIGWGIAASQMKPAVPTVKAVRGDIVEEVRVTGSTKAVQNVDLSFERTGKVSGVYVKVGQKVKAGQTLVELEKGDLIAQLAQAQAGVASAQATLDSLKRGTRPEEIAIQEVRVANAQVALNQAQKANLDALADAFAKADDAARNKTDAIFDNPRSGNPQISFIVTNPQAEIDAKTQKAAVENLLNSWKPQVDALSSDSDLVTASEQGLDNLNAVKAFLDKVALMLNNSLPTPDILQTTLDTYKTNTSTARSAVATAITTLNTAETSLKSAQANLALEQNNLALKLAGSTAEQIAAQEATVRQAEAAVQGIQVSLAKTVLRSPISGVITVQNAKLGQIVTVMTSGVSNSSLISIISESKLEIDANIPEVDIGRVAIGQPVGITFDALPREQYHGTVAEVDPAETIIDGVVNYRIKVAIDDASAGVKSGLTANLTIKTKTKEGVIILPQYAIMQNDEGTFVRVPDGKGTKDLPVVLGARDQNGMVEIVSGVTEGQEVQNVGIKTK